MPFKFDKYRRVQLFATYTCKTERQMNKSQFAI